METNNWVDSITNEKRKNCYVKDEKRKNITNDLNIASTACIRGRPLSKQITSFTVYTNQRWN